MTETSISLLSIICGIIGANGTGWFFKNKSIGLTGNTIIGVFGSVFFIKSLGRLGFDQRSIMVSGELNIALLTYNLAVSVLGGVLFLVLAKKVKGKL